MCRFIDLADEYYFFMIESKYPKIENEYGGCSFFKKDKTDYCVGTAETKILLNEKITCIGTENEVIKERIGMREVKIENSVLKILPKSEL